MKCKVENCNNESFALGYCKMHYFRFKRNGDPEKIKKRGRKEDKYRNAMIKIFNDVCSIRTIDKIIACNIAMYKMNLTQEKKLQILRAAERPNKTINAEKLIRLVNNEIDNFNKKAHQDDKNP